MSSIKSNEANKSVWQSILFLLSFGVVSVGVMFAVMIGMRVIVDGGGQ